MNIYTIKRCYMNLIIVDILQYGNDILSQIQRFSRKHTCVASERIDIFIHNENVVLELKATAKPIQSHESAQIKSILTNLIKSILLNVFGIVINFPQPTSKEIPSEILQSNCQK